MQMHKAISLRRISQRRGIEDLGLEVKKGHCSQRLSVGSCLKKKSRTHVCVAYNCCQMVHFAAGSSNMRLNSIRK